MNSSRPAVTALVLANALVVIGPLLLKWDLHALFALYCMELVVIGLFNIGKMYKATQLGELGKSRSYQVIFFIAHYATFCVLYRGVVLMSLGGNQSLDMPSFLAIGIGTALFTASHGISFAKNYIGLQEFSQASSLRQMWVPYRRVLPVQAVVVVCMMVVTQFEGGKGALIVLIGLKTLADLGAHLREHARPATS